MEPGDSEHPDLIRVLDRSRQLGFLGVGDVREHVRHASAFIDAVGTGPHVLDLGSGGGLPGLVMAVARADLQLVLLDANERRCAFLRWAVEQLGRGDVTVVRGRAEELAHGTLRGRFDVVVARSFGPPPLVAECGGPFLRADGLLLVSEPVDELPGQRWPVEGLARIGLVPEDVRRDEWSTIQSLRLAGPVDDGYPRSLRRMRRDPLF